jgi:membrane dipeptidase
MNNWFFALLTALVLSACSQIEVANPPSTAPEYEIVHISGDLYRARSDGHFTIFLVTPEGIILADPINEGFSLWLKDELAERFDSTVRYVLYSHHHWDHASGGAVFADTAVFVGHENMLTNLSAPLQSNLVFSDANGDQRIQRSEAAGGTLANFDRLDANSDDELVGAEINVDIVLPSITYSDSLTVSLGGSQVQMVYAGNNHSNDGSILLFTDEDAAYVVDWINFNRLPGSLNGAPLEDWLASLDRLIDLGAASIVPGHGDIGLPEDLASYRQYFQRLKNAADAAISNGIGLQEFADSIDMQAYSNWTFYDRLRVTNATQAYELALETLHQSLVTVDTHIDIPIQLGSDLADPGIDGPMQVDFPKMHSGGLDTGFFIVYVGQTSVTAEEYESAYGKAQDKFAGIERMLNRYPEQIALARSPDEVRDILASGKLVAAIGVENAFPLGPNLEYLQEFYERGARYVSLTHFGHNDFGSSSASRAGAEGYVEPEHEGLSALGKQLIDELNALGIMVDVSHTSRESTLQASAYSKSPVIASHSGVRALYDHIRNLTDEEIVAIAESGGVIQLVAFDSYMRPVSEENSEAISQVREELGFVAGNGTTEEAKQEYRMRLAALDADFPRASIETLVDNIDYVVNLVGVDHAGISSDFGGGGGIKGWDHIGESSAVTQELVIRGYSEEDIRKIWGENLLRVWQEVEDSASR